MTPANPLAFPNKPCHLVHQILHSCPCQHPTPVSHTAPPLAAYDLGCIGQVPVRVPHCPTCFQPTIRPLPKTPYAILSRPPQMHCSSSTATRRITTFPASICGCSAVLLQRILPRAGPVSLCPLIRPKYSVHSTPLTRRCLCLLEIKAFLHLLCSSKYSAGSGSRVRRGSQKKCNKEKCQGKKINIFTSVPYFVPSAPSLLNLSATDVDPA